MPRKYESEGNIPSSNDPRWLSRCRPLITFLSGGPRAWPELKRWARESDTTTALLQNMLSWLSLQRRTDLADGVWHLVSEADRQERARLEAQRQERERREAPTARPGPWMFEEHGGDGAEEI